MPLSTGARLGPYGIVSALGAGGMGEVYQARDSALNRDVALRSCQICSLAIPIGWLDFDVKRRSLHR